MPGAAAPIISGTSATPADSAVISTGVSRSRLPRTTSSRPHGMPSCSARLMVWLTLRMPLRAAIPVSVMKPTMLATDSGWPASHSAATAPIRASGRLPMMISASTAER